MADIIGVSITQESVQVVPGESTAIDITIKNNSNVVDVLYIAVEGLDPAWYQLSIVQSSLFPGDEASGTLTITPPKSSDATAGSYPFTVISTSQKDSTQSTSLAVDLQVKPFHSFEMNVNPQKVTGARGSYRLSIKNSGNADLNINLEGKDPEDLCRFTFDPQRPRVSPGEELEVAVEVVPGSRPFTGRAKGYRLTLVGTADPGTAEPVSIPAELDASARVSGVFGRAFKFMKRPPRPASMVRKKTRIPKWAKIVVGLVVALVIIVVVLVSGLFGGGGDSYNVAFLLNPDDSAIFGFEIPDAEATRIDVESEWANSGATLAVVVNRPDGSVLDSLSISGPGGSITFLVDAEAEGLSGWVIGLTNISTNQIDGTLEISFSK